VPRLQAGEVAAGPSRLGLVAARVARNRVWGEAGEGGGGGVSRAEVAILAVDPATGERRQFLCPRGVLARRAARFRWLQGAAPTAGRGPGRRR
jgi:hypothetical protein